MTFSKEDPNKDLFRRMVNERRTGKKAGVPPLHILRDLLAKKSTNQKEEQRAVEASTSSAANSSSLV